jgi:hypothetical protein
MSTDAKPDQPPTLMTQYHQSIEQFEERGRYHKEIDRSNACRMVAQKGSSSVTVVVETSAPCMATVDCATSIPRISSSP